MLMFIKKNFKSVKQIVAIVTFLLPSFLRIPILRLVGFKIGKKVTISPFTIISAEEVEIGNDVYICPFVLIFNLKKLKLGNKAYISLGNVIYGHGLGKFETGDFFYTGLFCLLNCTSDISIGTYSALGARSMVYTHGSFLPKDRGFSNQYSPVRIGDYAWIMMGVKVVPGVIIGNNVIVHSGVTVNRSIPDNSVYTYERSNFKAYPMTILYKKTVDQEYIDRWKKKMFLDLPLVLKDYFNFEIDCVKKDMYWEVNSVKKNIKIWDGDIFNHSEQKEFGKEDVILGIKDDNLNKMKFFCNINWLNVKLNLYNNPKESLFFDYLRFYLELKYGVLFTLYEEQKYNESKINIYKPY